MNLRIDGDSCPRSALKVALSFQSPGRFDIEVIADRILKDVDGTGARMTVVAHGSGEVDAYILDASQPGDLVLTRDVLLASGLLNKQVLVFNDSGRIWTKRDLDSRIRDMQILKAMSSGNLAPVRFRSGGKSGHGALKGLLERLLTDGKPEAAS